MPATVNANNMTVVHAGSNGISSIFPDTCKTPTPGGPVPIPYPNVAMSSDTADGSSTVTVDGNPIMLKGSNYRMSTGDEAGAAMGVASNKIKGKAEPVNYSFDVKVDGANVFRLSDMMLQNSGSPANTPPGTNVQPPNPAMPTQKEACQKTEKKKKQGEQKSTSWGKSGIVSPHQAKIQGVANDLKVVLYFRQTKTECEKWILAKHQPKPHSVLAGTTIIEGDKRAATQRWLDAHFDRMSDEQKASHPWQMAHPMMTNAAYSPDARHYIGIVGSTEDGMDKGKPLPGGGEGESGTSYEGKWITGDYDLFQVLEAGDGCQEVCQDGEKFAQVKAEINKRLHWDAIQHGPQAQWAPTQEELGDIPLFDMHTEVKKALKGDPKHSVPFAKGRPNMKVLDSPLTIVAGNGATLVENEDEVRDALLCKECEK